MSMAMKYAMKKRMARGGMASEEASGYGEMPCRACEGGMCMEHGGNVDGDDMIGRIMTKRKGYSEGGRVANQDEEITGDMPNEFDDLHLRDDLESSYTGKNSGDDVGDAEHDEEDRDMVSRIMRSRKLKDRNPRPA